GKRHKKKKPRKAPQHPPGIEGSHPAMGDDPNGTMPIDPYDPMVGPGGGPTKALRQRADHWVPKPPGTTQHLSLYYGPFPVPPGQDFNRVDLEPPMSDGFIETVAPYMSRVKDPADPNPQQG